MSSGRPALSGIDQHLRGSQAVVEVTLTVTHDRHTGTAEGDGDPSHRARLVGEATLRAVQSLAPDLALDLRAVGTSELGSLRIALAQVRENGHDLVGSALIHGGDPVMATAKAVLNALNRRLTAEG
jgi:hypothetical protein